MCHLERATRRNPRPRRPDRRRTNGTRARDLRHRASARRRDPARRHGHSRGDCRELRWRGESVLVPEDRKQSGLLLGHAIADNIALASWDRFSPAGVSSPMAHSTPLPAIRVAAFDIHPPRPAALMSARCRAATSRRWCWPSGCGEAPQVLIFDEPTRGVDVGAKHEIYAMLRQACRRRRRGPDDLQRHGGGDRRQRPHRRDARGPDQRHPPARPVLGSTMSCTWPSAAPNESSEDR